MFGFESATPADGSTVHLLAMELVEGEDLQARLKRGAIPIDEALAINRGRVDDAEIDGAHAVLVTGWREELARFMSGER